MKNRTGSIGAATRLNLKVMFQRLELPKVNNTDSVKIVTTPDESQDDYEFISTIFRLGEALQNHR